MVGVGLCMQHAVPGWVHTYGVSSGWIRVDRRAHTSAAPSRAMLVYATRELAGQLQPCRVPAYRRAGRRGRGVVSGPAAARRRQASGTDDSDPIQCPIDDLARTESTVRTVSLQQQGRRHCTVADRRGTLASGEHALSKLRPFDFSFFPFSSYRGIHFPLSIL